MSRDTYKVLAEKYKSLYTEERVVFEVPFTPDELRVLTTLYDFQKVKNTDHLFRIPAAGETETIIKYNDGSFVCDVKDSRHITKHEFTNFLDLVHKMSREYKASDQVRAVQELPKPGENERPTIEAS